MRLVGIVINSADGQRAFSTLTWPISSAPPSWSPAGRQSNYARSTSLQQALLLRRSSALRNFPLMHRLPTIRLSCCFPSASAAASTVAPSRPQTHSSPPCGPFNPAPAAVAKRTWRNLSAKLSPPSLGSGEACLAQTGTSYAASSSASGSRCPCAARRCAQHSVHSCSASAVRTTASTADRKCYSI